MDQVRSIKLWLAGASLLIGAGYLYATSLIRVSPIADPVGAKAFPTLVGVGFFVAAALLIIEHLREPDSEDDLIPRGTKLPVVGLVAFAWTVFYILIFEPAGYVVSTVVFLLPMLFYFYRGHVLVNVATAIGFTLISYFLLKIELGASLPSGLLRYLHLGL